ncbi:MAG: TetR/AcrR family transcriptional regulator [Alphaproteobacteria bacterium]|nr:TetR/AcrR family transcriptional regulator [Alphaproteobacteria bacterium]
MTRGFGKQMREKDTTGPAGRQKVGLHQRNRDRRTRMILKVAATMFRERGYDAARIEDIAERAEVSPGTVYTYFKTKENILLSILALHRESSIERRLRIVQSPPDDLTEAFVRYERALLTDATHYLDRDLWRRVTAAGIMATSSKIGGRSVMIDRLANRERLQILETLRERGLLPRGFAVEQVAEILRAVSYHVWIRFLRGELRSLALAKKTIARNVEFVLGRQAIAQARARAA